ncbi:hypothetical protein PILCRDRAFT_14277 [Piloderma croceum F 1598]|uniref:CHAT domain-containing protein n=1 Tax=Piloderma croceum (strain F 1598) TaxID=765440 RepID=A0A0C3AL63_PILCF|nr:hypothetical protein PILCRDRAFT_14277 [Piloderma croceum F 1598]
MAEVPTQLTSDDLGGTDVTEQPLGRNTSSPTPATLPQESTDEISTQPVTVHNGELLVVKQHTSTNSTLQNPPVHVTERDAATGEDGDESSQLYDFALSLFEECKNAALLSDIDTAIYLFREAFDQLSAPHPLRSRSLKDLAGALVTRFYLSREPEDLDQASPLYVEIERTWNDVFVEAKGQTQLDNDPPTEYDSRLTSELSDLAKSILTNFNQAPQLSNLDTVAMLHREALLLRHSPHQQRPLSLRGLATTLYTRFRRTDDRRNLNEAISLLREAAQASFESSAYRMDILDDLFAALATRFDKTGQLVDLRNAIEQRAYQTLSFAESRFKQFLRSGQITDLEASVSSYRKGYALLPVHHPNRLHAFDELAMALMKRFEQLGQRQDLDEAILMLREALEQRPVPHPDRPGSLTRLGDGLLIKFQHSNKLDDLDEATLFDREALQLRPAPHPNRSKALQSLGSALILRYKRLGQREDLTEAISLNREALGLRSMTHFDRLIRLGNLAISLKIKFGQEGRLEDLDEAVLLHREAVVLTPAPHPDRSLTLFNLADALHVRFAQSRRWADLDEAMLLHREVLELRPAPHPGRFKSLDNLGVILRILFQTSGQREDIALSLSLHREALELQPATHPLRPFCLQDLAVALWARFEKFGLQEDIDDSISVHRNALQLLPTSHPSRSSSLNNLASALGSRFNLTGQRHDLDAAINTYNECLSAFGSGHPLTCGISYNLGITLADAYSHTREAEYLDKAIAAFQVSVACESAPISRRYTAARTWATHADNSHHESALDAYHAAIEFLPRLATLGLDLQSRQRILVSWRDGLARDAAACALRFGRPDRAVELLEGGRTVFWAQALQLHKPTMDLRDTAPELEEQLRRISIALEQGSFRDASTSPSHTMQKVMSMEQETSHFRRLNDKWLATLEQVRRLSGFQDFLRPSRLSTLQCAANNGPIVILNASQTGCNALILTSTGVQHTIPFPDLNFTLLTKLVKLLRYAIGYGGSRDAPLLESNRELVEDILQQMPFISDTLQLRLPSERHLGRISTTSSQPDEVFRFVLGVLWVSVSKPIIGMLELKKSDMPPNLWWCPTGPFSFLPIHAAGIYLTEMTETISDYVVSSYTPTISSLLGDTPPSTTSFNMMVVIQPDTPGQKSLPYTLDELRKIEAHVPNNHMIKLVHGSVNEVISHLPTASVIHFACHGQQNRRNPLECALLLQDGPLKVSQIMQQPMSNASLAFLSACETAMGDENFPDEVFHLGATLLFTGFRGVVATMWSIADPDGPNVADTFYAELFKPDGSTKTDGFHPDTTQAARALHIAVTKLRSENVSFIRWVPFIHIGR